MNAKIWAPLAAAAMLLGAPAVSTAAGDAAAKPAAKPAALKAPKKNVKTFEIAVTSEGFTPAEIKVKAGETVRLVVTRKTDRTCAKEIVLKDFGIEKALPLDKAVTVEVTPSKPGNVRFACSMDMVAGTIVVE